MILKIETRKREVAQSHFSVFVFFVWKYLANIYPVHFPQMWPQMDKNKHMHTHTHTEAEMTERFTLGTHNENRFQISANDFVYSALVKCFPLHSTVLPWPWPVVVIRGSFVMDGDHPLPLTIHHPVKVPFTFNIFLSHSTHSHSTPVHANFH